MVPHYVIHTNLHGCGEKSATELTSLCLAGPVALASLPNPLLLLGGSLVGRARVLVTVIAVQRRMERAICNDSPTVDTMLYRLLCVYIQLLGALSTHFLPVHLALVATALASLPERTVLCLGQVTSAQHAGLEACIGLEGGGGRGKEESNEDSASDVSWCM